MEACSTMPLAQPSWPGIRGGSTEKLGLVQRLGRSAPPVKSMETHVSELLGYYESVLSERKARRGRA